VVNFSTSTFHYHPNTGKDKTFSKSHFSTTIQTPENLLLISLFPKGNKSYFLLPHFTPIP